MHTKTVHVDRAVQFPSRYTKTLETSSSVTLTADPGTITQAGTAENASVFNNIENGIINGMILTIMGAI